MNQLIENYANHLVESMDMSSLCQFAYEQICENLEKMDENELMDSIQECAPHLLDDTNQ